MDFSKYLGEVGLAELWNLMIAYMDKKVFVGTQDEYNEVASTLPIGAIVVIIDKEEEIIPPPIEDEEEILPPSQDETVATACLGTAKLGAMILGKK